MTLRDFAADVAAHLAAGGLSLTLGTNLFIGKMPPSRIASAATPLVSVMTIGGPPPIDYCNGSAHTPQLYQPTVQVLVRSPARDWSAGDATARGCFDVMNDTVPTSYFGSRAQTAAPLYLGEDEAGEHSWTIPVTLWIEE